MALTYKANLWKIYLFAFLTGLHFIGGVLVPFYTQWGGITFGQIMILQSFFMLSVFLLEIPTGTIADHMGRKQSLLFGTIVSAIGALVYASTPNFFVFLLGEFLLAVAVALFSGAKEAFVYDTLKKIKSEKQSKKIFGRLHSIHLSAIMIGAPIGSVIGAKFGLNVPMALFAFPTLIAFFVGLSFKEPITRKKQESTRYLKILKEGVRFFYKNKILKILAFDMISISAIAYFMIWLYQPMLMRSNVDVAYFGIVHAGFVLSQILIANNYVFLEKLFGSKKGLIFWSSMILGIMFVVSGLTSYLPVILLVIILGGGFGLTRVPLFSSYMNKYIPSDKRATVLSSVSMLRKFVLVIFNPFVGFLVDWSLNYTLIMLGVLAIVFAFVSRVEEKHLLE